MKILVTGAAGLIGSEIVTSLVSAGHEVVATDRVRIDAPPSVTTVIGDLTSADFIAQLDFSCDAVIHMGSVPSPRHDTDALVLQNNVMGSYQIFAAAVAKKVPLVIYASSLSIYGTAWSDPWTSPEYAPFDEEHPLHHFESYALSKEVNERSADMWANHDRQRHLLGPAHHRIEQVGLERLAPPSQEFRTDMLIEFLCVDEQAVEIEGDGLNPGWCGHGVALVVTSTGRPHSRGWHGAVRTVACPRRAHPPG